MRHPIDPMTLDPITFDAITSEGAGVLVLPAEDPVRETLRPHRPDPSRTPFSVPGAALDGWLDDLRQVARRADTGSRRQRAALTARLRTGVATLVTDGTADVPVELGDVFDPFSGGVRLRHWEVPTGATLPHARRLFRLDPGTPDAWHRRLHTDTSVLLRGGLHYVPYAQRAGLPAAAYLPMCRDFLVEAQEVVHELAAAPADLLAFKMLAAVHDAARGMLLHTATAAYLMEKDAGTGAHPATSAVLTVAAEHLRHHLDLLFGGVARDQVHDASVRTLRQVAAALSAADDRLGLSAALADPAPARRLLRERHGDDLLENLAAVELGLHHLLPGTPDAPVTCVALVAGGIEPAMIATRLLGDRGLASTLRLVRHSPYPEGGEAPRRPAPTMPFGHDTRTTGPVIVFDDVVLTGRTLHRALGELPDGSVTGAVVTRYPGLAMVPHLRHRGFPHPGRLLRDVRGLVTALPSGGIGDSAHHKSEGRILRYLHRNRTDLGS
jgi:hypothetical protein